MLQASDGAGHIGRANAIDVVLTPMLSMTQSGSSLLLFWPVDPAGFIRGKFNQFGAAAMDPPGDSRAIRNREPISGVGPKLTIRISNYTGCDSRCLDDSNGRSPLLEEGFRWFGPAIRCRSVLSGRPVDGGVHVAAPGSLWRTWPREAICTRKEQIEAAGLRWRAVESVPIHEDIKTGSGDLKRLFENYSGTLQNLAAEGISLVIYNFMPGAGPGAH